MDALKHCTFKYPCKSLRECQIEVRKTTMTSRPSCYLVYTCNARSCKNDDKEYGIDLSSLLFSFNISLFS